MSKRKPKQEARKVRRFDVGPVTLRSMPFWCVANPMADSSGKPVLPPSAPVETCSLICDAAEQGFIEATSFRDNDIVPWNSTRPEDDLLRGPTRDHLLLLKSMLDEYSVKC